MTRQASLDPLPRQFFDLGAPDAARRLLGGLLVRLLPEGMAIGRIVETEAYVGPTDPASHTYELRRTRRTEVQYGPPGYAYVYSLHGHSCLCVVTAPPGKPEVVLIRALEPLAGIDAMARRRGLEPVDSGDLRKERLLTSGPGRLCHALAISTTDNGADLCSPGSLWVARGATGAGARGGSDNQEKGPWLLPGEYVAVGPRVNIDYAGDARDWPWRFSISGNPCVSASGSRSWRKEDLPGAPLSRS